MCEPHIAQKAPFAIALEADKTYYWRACGKSANQPFCDASHKGSEFSPKPFVAAKDGSARLCGRKHSKNAPYCDGSRRSL